MGSSELVLARVYAADHTAAQEVEPDSDTHTDLAVVAAATAQV